MSTGRPCARRVAEVVGPIELSVHGLQNVRSEQIQNAFGCASALALGELADPRQVA